MLFFISKGAGLILKFCCKKSHSEFGITESKIFLFGY